MCCCAILVDLAHEFPEQRLLEFFNACGGGSFNDSVKGDEGFLTGFHGVAFYNVSCGVVG